MSSSIVGVWLLIALGGLGITVLVIALVLKKRESAFTLIGMIVGVVFAAALLLSLLAPATMRRSTTTVQQNQGAATMPAQSDSAQRTDQPASPPSRDSSLSGQLITGGALAALLLLAYLFLDAGTRGRYTWPLRIGAVAMFAGLCFVLWKYGVDWM